MLTALLPARVVRACCSNSSSHSLSKTNDKTNALTCCPGYDEQVHLCPECQYLFPSPFKRLSREPHFKRLYGCLTQAERLEKMAARTSGQRFSRISSAAPAASHKPMGDDAAAPKSRFPVVMGFGRVSSVSLSRSLSLFLPLSLSLSLSRSLSRSISRSLSFW